MVPEIVSKDLRGFVRGLLAVLCLSVAVFGSAPTAASEDKATQFYEEATNAYKNGKLEKAIDLLKKAYSEDENLVYQYNRIMALQRLHRYEKAMKVLDKYRSKMVSDERFGDILDIRKALLEKVEAIESLRGTARTLGQSRQKLVQKVILKTAAKAVGRRASSTTTGIVSYKVARTRGGELGQYTVNRVAERLAAAKPLQKVETTSLPSSEDGSSSTLGWSLVGLGIASSTAAVLFGAEVFLFDVKDRRNCWNDAISKYSNQGYKKPEVKRRALQECYSKDDDVGEREKQMLQDDQSTYELQRRLTWILGGIGAVATVSGVLTLVFSGNSGQKDSKASSSVLDRLEVGPVVTGQGAGGMILFRF